MKKKETAGFYETKKRWEDYGKGYMLGLRWSTMKSRLHFRNVLTVENRNDFRIPEFKELREVVFIRALEILEEEHDNP